MSLDVLVQLGTKGADAVIGLTKEALDKAVKEKGRDHAVSFPETNYFFPLAYALLKIEVKTLADCLEVVRQAEALNADKAASSGLHIEALGGVLNKGLATLLCEETLAAVSGLPGFLSDVLLRSLGVQLVDGRICGIAVILGPAKDADAAAQLIRDLQARSVVSILAGSVKGNSFQKQLETKKVQMGLEDYIVPLGEDYLSAIYAVNWAIRAPLTFGGLKSGQWQEMLKYEKEKVPALVVLLSHVDEILVATGLGALSLGFPIITDLEVPQLPKIDTTLYEALVTEKDYKKIAAKCVETRGLKVKVGKLPIPVPYAPAFEGERVRKEQMYAEFGGKKSPAFEYLISAGMNEVEDGKIEVIGPEIDQMKEGGAYPLGIVVRVAGRKMQVDFEPILERQIHKFFNYAMGLFHMGQRDMNWVRISKDAKAAGFKMRHFGDILIAKLHDEYGAIADKVSVAIYTTEADVKKILPQAQKTFEERDRRIAGMKDEDVDVFYSCTLCQSFAPDHVCMISPQRLGLCGAYSWLDGKAAHQITPTGGNQPVKKGRTIDAQKGIWEGINQSVYDFSHRKISQISVYSIIDSPMTSCGCFECVVAVVPEANGVMVVNREYAGPTPVGMKFTTLAGSVGGGAQTPGFLGVGRLYITSEKFISAEGGLRRVVWMPKELKDAILQRLDERSKEMGEPDLVKKIADETVATDAQALVNFLKKVGHPALSMPPLI